MNDSERKRNPGNYGFFLEPCLVNYGSRRGVDSKLVHVYTIPRVVVLRTV